MKMLPLVKWEGTQSKPIQIKQGVRQCGVMSTGHYKRNNNPLIIELEEKFSGAKIGNIKIPHTTCADDLALLSNFSWEMKTMLKTVENFSQNYRYEINATKDACLPLNSESMIESSDLLLNGLNIPVESSTIHLGLNGTTKGICQYRGEINLWKKTPAYSLLGAGLRGKTSVKQDVKAHIWSTFVVARITYGLEALPFTESDLKKLDSSQVKSLK